MFGEGGVETTSTKGGLKLGFESHAFACINLHVLTVPTLDPKDVCLDHLLRDAFCLLRGMQGFDPERASPLALDPPSPICI